MKKEKGQLIVLSATAVVTLSPVIALLISK